MNPLRFLWVVALFAMLQSLAMADAEVYPDSAKQIEQTSRTIPLIQELGEKGLLKNLKFTSQKAQRNARIYIPENYDSKRPIGILFGFHGYYRDLQRAPQLKHLWFYEHYAESEYFICVSLTTPYLPELPGWQWGWDQRGNGLENNDVKAVYDLLLMLKEKYAIDDDRIFADGLSNGGGFVHALANNLPGVFAAVSTSYPHYAKVEPSKANRYATISSGGTLDEYHTAEYNQDLNRARIGKGIEGDFYVFHVPHIAPLKDDANLTPALSFKNKVIEFFREHPRNYQFYGYVPRVSGSSFTEGFDNDELTTLSRETWRVQTYDEEGTLWDKKGFTFRQQKGKLVNQALAQGKQGGLCLLEFYNDPQQDFSLEFTVQKKGDGFYVTPALLSDTHGQIIALTLDGTTWAWQLYSTLLDYRFGHPASMDATQDSYTGEFPVEPFTLSLTGAAPLQEGNTYKMQLTRGEQCVDWQLLTAEGEKVANGDFKLPNPGAIRYGLGVVGNEQTAVAFDNISMQTSKTVSPRKTEAKQPVERKDHTTFEIDKTKCNYDVKNCYLTLRVQKDSADVWADLDVTYRIQGGKKSDGYRCLTGDTEVTDFTCTDGDGKPLEAKIHGKDTLVWFFPVRRMGQQRIIAHYRLPNFLKQENGHSVLDAPWAGVWRIPVQRLTVDVVFPQGMEPEVSSISPANYEYTKNQVNDLWVIRQEQAPLKVAPYRLEFTTK